MSLSLHKCMRTVTKKKTILRLQPTLVPVNHQEAGAAIAMVEQTVHAVRVQPVQGSLFKILANGEERKGDDNKPANRLHNLLSPISKKNRNHLLHSDPTLIRSPVNVVRYSHSPMIWRLYRRRQVRERNLSTIASRIRLYALIVSLTSHPHLLLSYAHHNAKHCATIRILDGLRAYSMRDDRTLLMVKGICMLRQNHVRCVQHLMPSSSAQKCRPCTEKRRRARQQHLDMSTVARDLPCTNTCHMGNHQCSWPRHPAELL